VRTSTVRRLGCLAFLVTGLTLTGPGVSLAVTGQPVSGTATAFAAVGAPTSTVTFTGQGVGASKKEALVKADQDARQRAAEQGFTDCTVVAISVAAPIWPGGFWSADAVIECTEAEQLR
jgi:hypothetical protein